MSAPLRNDNIRSHVHSQPVFAIDQSSSPFDSRTPAQRSRMVLRSQTLDPAPSSSAMKNGLYLSESNLPGHGGARAGFGVRREPVGDVVVAFHVVAALHHTAVGAELEFDV